MFCETDYGINPLTPELNPSVQRCLSRFFTGDLISKWLTARRLYNWFGVKGLINLFFFARNNFQWAKASSFTSF
jgi:hypothetical protein